MAEQHTGVFFVHSFHYLYTAFEARRVTAEKIRENSAEMPADALVAIVFSAFCLEAFANELAEMAARDVRRPIVSSETFDRIRDLSVVLDEVETGHGSVELKYHLISRILTGKAFDPGIQPFQDFRSLIRLRNDLAHVKHGDKTEADGSITAKSAVVRQLEQSGLTYPPYVSAAGTPPGMSWLNKLETTGPATWACNSAVNMLRAVGERLPDERYLMGISSLKQQILDLQMPDLA